MEEKIDILLTTYNTKIEYLKIQLDSILNQTYKNFNLIISDDCSTDKNVRAVLEEYANKDNRITLYFQEKNLGYTKNFEFVLEKSNAEYIAFSDHDDIWYPKKIEKSLNVLKEMDVDLVYSDARQIDENGNILHNSYLRYKNMPIINEKYFPKMFKIENNKITYNRGKYFILPFSRHIAIGCSQLFTKQVKELMLPFTENTIAHDWHSVYIACNLKGVYCIDEPFFGYRLHGNNAFGGRSFAQNIKIWKNENGSSYNSFLKYRNKVIIKTYLAGALMCKDYTHKIFENDEGQNNLNKIENNVNNQKKLEIKNENEVIKYFEEAQKSKVFYWKIHRYFRYLSFKGIRKRAFKEIAILHFPILSFMIFKLK